jgi:hypothetical protein
MMCSLKQKELTIDAVLQMNDQICDDCPEASGCKKYLQWMRLNPITITIRKDHLHSHDADMVERPYVRSHMDEIFW